MGGATWPEGATVIYAAGGLALRGGDPYTVVLALMPPSCRAVAARVTAPFDSVPVRMQIDS